MGKSLFSHGNGSGPQCRLQAATAPHCQVEMVSHKHPEDHVCLRLGLPPHTFPVSPRGQSLSLTVPGCRLAQMASDPESSVPRAPVARIPEGAPQASGLCAGGEHCCLLPPGLGCVSSHLIYEWSPDKGSGPPAVIMPTLQTSKLSLGGPRCASSKPHTTFAPDGHARIRLAEQTHSWVWPGLRTCSAMAPTAWTLCEDTPVTWC